MVHTGKACIALQIDLLFYIYITRYSKYQAKSYQVPLRLLKIAGMQS